MKKMIELLGDDSAKVGYVYARTGTWDGLVHNSADRNHLQPFRNGKLGFITPDYNNYEGCCLFQNKWWMGGEGQFKDTPYEVLRYLADNNLDKGASKYNWFRLIKITDNGCRQCSNKKADQNQNVHAPYPPGKPTKRQQTLQ